MSINVTPAAIKKLKELRESDLALRFGVKGGGCSGFSYSMQWDNEKGQLDKQLDFDGLRVLIDPISIMYLDGTTIDYVETLEASGFKFINPNVKSTCGCGSSFSA